MKLVIVFEDREMLVVNKPAGLVVNRSQTIDEETLQDQIAKYLNLESSLGIENRAGIVHRLDRETSGLLVVAKTIEAFNFLQKQFKERKVKKEYLALVHGLVIQKEATIEAALGRIGKFGKFGVISKSDIGGRKARTDFKVSGYWRFKDKQFDRLIEKIKVTRSRVNYLKNHGENYSLLRLFPLTGRTHQVRVHLKSIGHPIVSDLLYAPSKLLKFDLLWCPRLYLHAAKIVFFHPSNLQKVEFSLDLPNDLKESLSFLTINQ